ncbi:hypothetical protein SRABI106_01465 [Rahnella aquatilis]|nr:hypothetical protein SRABI106_01465 [Rahnella aquatilis]
MRLVENWKQCWKWFSIHALLIAGVLPSVWATLPPDLKAYIPPSIMGLITAVVAVSGVVGRLTDQSKKS